MKFGIRYSNTGPYSHPGPAIELVQAAERAGFESAWTVEHVLIPPIYESIYPYSPDGKMPASAADTVPPDPLVWMAFCAAQTSTLIFGTAVMILPQYNPVLLAKQVVTLDQLSAGRLILGVGVGWLREEFDALGVKFTDRGARADEYIAAMRHLWSDKGGPFSGAYVSFGDVSMQPKPSRDSIPIHIGGDSVAAARRAGRLGDGYFPARGIRAELLEALRRSADEAGRDPDQIELTVSMPESEGDLERLAALGVSRVAVPVMGGHPGVAHYIDAVSQLEDWSEVISKYAEL
jgi:probable F420-dependent oxidoreductase